MARTRKIEKQWTLFEDVRAEYGVVMVTDTDGKVHRFSVKDAANRCAEINKALGSRKIPEVQRKKTFAFVTKMMEAIREASYQREAPKDLATKIVTNVTRGLTAAGKPMPQATTYAEMLARIQLKYPYLQPEEIEKVCGEPTLSTEEKQEMFATINTDRMMIVMQQMERRRAAAVETPAE